jgi:hypothetical protein
MEVTCPQCQAKQQLSAQDAALFWAVCAECGVVHGPATAKAGEGLLMTSGATMIGDQLGEPIDWAPASEIFEDILTFGDVEEGGSSSGEPCSPEDLSAAVAAASPEAPDQAAFPADTPNQLVLEAARGVNRGEEGDTLPVDNAQAVVHLSEPPEAGSEWAWQLAKPKPFVLRRLVPARGSNAVGVRVLYVASTWLLLICAAFIGLSLFLSWASKPADRLGAGAAGSASGGSKTEAKNQSSPQATPALRASVNPVPNSDETAPAGRRGMEAQAEKVGAVTAAPNAQGADEGGGNFTAQVGSFSDISKAGERVSALRAAGFEARAVEAEVPGRGVWYRVQCGRFGTREEAARFGARLRAEGGAREVIIAEIRKQ